MSNPKKKGTGVKLWSVMTVVMVILLIASIIGTNIALGASQAINIFLKTDTYKVVENGDGTEDTEYFKSDYATREELEAAGQLIAEEVAGEGAVLLLNNGALPLASGAKVSTVSHSSVDIITCGTGAADIDTSTAPTLKEALEEVGLVVNPTLWDFYTGLDKQLDANGRPIYARTPGKLANQTSGGSRDSYTVNEVPVDVYTADVTSSFASYGDAAIVTISRIAGEGADLAIDGFVDGTNILELTHNEKAMMEMVNENFDTVIVLINSTNAIDCSFLYDYDVDAALWIGYTGEWGLNAVADILVGNVNPSGHLVDTYCFDNTTAPAMVGIYGGSYSNYDPADTSKWYDVYGAQLDGNHTYILYQEGIYVGYRYYETRYEDVVMGTGNAGVFNYDETVAFPFGYGLSYTTFEWSDYKASYNAGSDMFTVNVKVTNTGDVPGKEVVQVYFQSPYTDYDKENGIEKAAIELCGFGKTGLLEPGASQVVTVTVKGEELTAYDENKAMTYILDAGDYYLTAASDAHKAVNNVLVAKGYDVDGDAAFTYKHTVDELDTDTYSVSSATGYAITNQFDSADLSQYGIDITYLSRSDWQGTWPQAMTLEATDKMFADGLYSYQTYQNIDNALSEATHGVYHAAEMPTMGAQNGLTLAMYIGTDYDDPAWEDLLDQLTFEEMAIMIGQGYHNTAAAASVGKPATIDDNGPQGFTQNLTGVAEAVTAYTDENIMAATFNVELMERMGQMLGEDCMELGASGLYGPAMNIHRNAYAGRNFEYYSEDPFLSGAIAAAETRGIQSKGVYVYLKHFALNDNETGCRCISTWANEQSIREIYLKPFEMAVVEGDAHAVMNAFARFGVVWSGAHRGLMTEVLRNEWGFDGFGLTDFSGNAAFASYGIMMKSYDVAHGLLAGTDSWDSSAVQWTDDLMNLYRNDPAICQAMRQAAHRILYTVANSNAMNGISSSTTIVPVTPWWQLALYGLMAVCGLGTVACGTKLVLSMGKKKAK